MRYNQRDRGLETMVTAYKPKILTIDIETSPMQALTWGQNMYETSLIKMVEYGQVMSYSAKWVGGKQETKGLNDYKGYKPGKLDDTKIVSDIHALLDEADIVVAHNGIDFDLRYVTARFAKHNLTPPSPYKVIDTKREAKRLLRIPSNKLDEVGKYLGIGQKLHHEGFELWEKCIAGDKKAWATMKRYNAQDVKLTEAVYLKLRPYLKNHPNMGTFLEQEACPKCGGHDLQNRGYSRTITAVYQRHQCMDCGGWSRSGTKENGVKALRNCV